MAKPFTREEKDYLRNVGFKIENVYVASRASPIRVGLKQFIRPDATGDMRVATVGNGTGWRMYTSPAFHDAISAFVCAEAAGWKD